MIIAYTIITILVSIGMIIALHLEYSKKFIYRYKNTPYYNIEIIILKIVFTLIMLISIGIGWHKWFI